MENHIIVNSISEISKDHRIGWLRQGDKYIKFASIKPFDKTCLRDSTPLNNLENEENHINEYLERTENSSQYYSNNRRNYYQNEPIHQRQYFDNRFSTPLTQPPQFVNGFLRQQPNGIQNSPAAPRITLPQLQAFPRNLNYPPIHSFNNAIPQVSSLASPTFFDHSNYPTTASNFTNTRRNFNQLLNSVGSRNSNLNRNYQQSQSLSRGYRQNSGVRLHSQQDIRRTTISTNNNDIQERDSSNSLDLSIDEDNIQQRVMSFNNAEVDVNRNNENIAPSINVSQGNVPNYLGM